MAGSALIKDELKQQIGDNAPDLMKLAFDQVKVFQDTTYLTGIKNERRFTTLKINKLMKPYTGNFNARANAIEFKPRTVNVKRGQIDIEVNPEDYRDTYLAQFQRQGVDRTPDDMPFGSYIIDEVAAAIGEEINSKAAYHGVYDDEGTDPEDVCNGYGYHIANLIEDDVITPVSTGVITADDAYDQFTAVWRNVPDKYRQNARWQMNMYVPVGAYELYEDCLGNKNWNFGRGDDALAPVYLRGSGGMCRLIKANWMTDTNRIFVTPLENILSMVDNPMDMVSPNIVYDVYKFKMGVLPVIGFDFRFGELVWCNNAS